MLVLTLISPNQVSQKNPFGNETHQHQVGGLPSTLELDLVVTYGAALCGEMRLWRKDRAVAGEHSRRGDRLFVHNFNKSNIAVYVPI
jgi:hypothetical protein